MDLNLAHRLLAWSVLAAAGPIQSAPPLSDVYLLSAPSFTANTMGYFSTGLALVDINGDSWDDMVISNGNDLSPQNLTVYYNQKNPQVFAQGAPPDWYSNYFGYSTDLAAGDINGDERIDVAVSLIADRTGNLGAGGVEIFLNQGGELSSQPDYRTGDKYASLGCALGDVDADGDLDLVVAVLFEEDDTPGHGRIYLNRGGQFDRTPAWMTDDGITAGGVEVADLNQDGWMDLAFAALKTSVYYGGPPIPGAVPIPRTPGWTSEDVHEFSFSVDAGAPGQVIFSPEIQVPTRQPLMLVAAAGCPTQQPCDSRFLGYEPKPGPPTPPVWKSTGATFASHVLLADLNEDGHLDLAADQWGGNLVSAQGGRLWLFAGNPQGWFNSTPDASTNVDRGGQSLAVADLRRRAVRSVTETFRATSPVAVLTLSRRRIQRIVQVKRSSHPPGSVPYAWAPQSNWISLPVLVPGETIEVMYQYSPVLDIAEAVGQPQHGSVLFFSFLNPN